MGINTTIGGKLVNVLGGHEVPEPGSAEIALCGYGSQVPRGPDLMFARVTSQLVYADQATGEWTASVMGNDVIVPSGTYYTVTVRNSNGDIVQVNAYVFKQYGNYDLDSTDPFDPSSQIPPSIPPAVLNLLLFVPYSSTPEFPGDTYTSWQITLNGDAAATFTNLVDGNLYTIIIVQDATGNHEFDWPDNVFNTTAINEDPNAMTIQTFVAVNQELYPIGPGTYQ